MLADGAAHSILAHWDGAKLWEQLLTAAMEANEDPYDSKQEDWKLPAELGGPWEHLCWSPDGSCFVITNHMHIFLFSFIPVDA